MKNIRICFSFLFVLALTSCADDNETPDLLPDNTTETAIKGKWFYYSEEELDEAGNVEAFWDLRDMECMSGFIVFKDNNLKEEEHADPSEDCEKYDYDGTWEYNKTENSLTIIDEEDGYLVKGTVINVDSSELRIKLLQQGEDTDFEDWNTHLVFRKSL